MAFIEYSEKILMLAFNCLKNKRSNSPDEVSVFLIRDVKALLCRPLPNRMNDSFRVEIFSKSLKLAFVKPIHQKDGKKSMQNYCLVPVASVIGYGPF